MLYWMFSVLYCALLSIIVEGNTPLNALEAAFGYHVSVCSECAQFNCGGFVKSAPPSRWCQACMGTVCVPLYVDSARPVWVQCVCTSI